MDHIGQRSDEALIRQATTTRKGRTKPANLREQVDDRVMRLWRTPAAANATQGPKSKEFYEHCLRTGQSTVTLVDEVRHNPGKMWPTPTANDAQNSSLPPSAKDWDSVPGAIMREGHTAQEGQLNPEWVEMLMNFPRGWTDME